jgi:hypothetical protein
MDRTYPMRWEDHIIECLDREWLEPLRYIPLWIVASVPYEIGDFMDMVVFEWAHRN